MAITQEQLDSFHQFASDRLLSSGQEISWQELFYLWRLENPTAVEEADIYAALDESLSNIENGKAQPLDEAMQELRDKHGIGGA